MALIILLFPILKILNYEMKDHLARLPLLINWLQITQMMLDSDNDDVTQLVLTACYLFFIIYFIFILLAFVPLFCLPTLSILMSSQMW